MKKSIDRSQILIHAFFLLVSIACLVPFALLVIASFTDEMEITRHGYSLFPGKFSLYAYEYLQSNIFSIARAYGITVLTTVIGTMTSLLLIALLAYPLSRKDMPYRKTFTFIVFFTMLFNGGLVPTYLMYSQIFHIKNTLPALIFPILLIKGFFVMLMKTFFKISIPPSVVESSNMDGAGEWRTFFSIILPLSVPVLATVGLFQVVNYWNDWFNGMIFLTDPKLYTIQNLLNRILMDLQFLTTNAVSSSEGAAAANIPSQAVRMALAVLGIFPLLVAYPFFQKYFVRGLVVGAVKN